MISCVDGCDVYKNQQIEKFKQKLYQLQNNTFKGIIVKEEEVKEGMEAEEEEESGEEEEEPEYDEHVWLSLKNAKTLTKAIADDLCEIDEEHKDIYMRNEKAYEEKLDTLDKEYQGTVDAASQKTLLFGDRFPFRYLVDDYGLDYYAAFVGCFGRDRSKL